MNRGTVIVYVHGCGATTCILQNTFHKAYFGIQNSTTGQTPITMRPHCREAPNHYTIQKSLKHTSLASLQRSRNHRVNTRITDDQCCVTRNRPCFHEKQHLRNGKESLTTLCVSFQNQTVMFLYVIALHHLTNIRKTGFVARNL